MKERTKFVFEWERRWKESQGGPVNMVELCRLFGISRQTGYLWVRRYREGNHDPAAMAERSRRPLTSPLAIPLEVQDLIVREDLLRWAERYQHHDALWMDSRALEVPAYRQLTDPAGELIQDGRALAAQVEAACRRPVYLYLLRHYGHDLGEEDRPCPACGRAWRQQPAGDDAPAAGLARFDFQCEPCRLVGHVAPSRDEDGLAQVGVWPAPRSAPS